MARRSDRVRQPAWPAAVGTIVDEMLVRRYTAAIFGAQAVALVVLALASGAAVLIVTSLIDGFCLGQITTLSPIVVHREFGAASFGAINGIPATVIQLTSALGPGIYGVLHDALAATPQSWPYRPGVEIIATTATLVSRAPKQAPDKEFAFVRSSLEAKD